MQACEPTEVGTGQGLLTGVQYGTAALSALGGAWLYDGWGASAAFGAGAIGSLLLWLAALVQGVFLARPGSRTAGLAPV